MRILVLYGPNLNLLGVVSRRNRERLILDKLNRAIRRQAGALKVELKIFQIQSETEASKLIQRQRNKVDGILLIPGIWARTGQLLRETVVVTELPLAVFHLEPQGGPWRDHEHSIFKEVAVQEGSGSSQEEVTGFLERLVTSLAA